MPKSGYLMLSISLLLLIDLYPTTESLPIHGSDESLESPNNSSTMIVRVVVTSSSSSSTSSEDFSQIHDFSLPVFSTSTTPPNSPKEQSGEARDYYSSSTTSTTMPTTVRTTSTSVSPVHKSEEVEDIFSAFYRAFSHSNSNSHSRQNSLSNNKRGFPPLISSRSLPPTPRRVDGGVTNEHANTAQDSQKVVSIVSSSKSSVVSIQKTPRPKVSVPSLYSIRRRNGSRKPGLTTTTTPSWQETEKVWGEPAKVWSLPAQVWSEPERVWSQPEKVWTPPSSPAPPKQKSWKQATQKQLELSSDYPNDEATSQQGPQEPSQEDEGVTTGPFVVLGEDENEQDSIDGEIDGHLVLPATLSSSSISKISSSNNYNEDLSNSKNNSQQQPHQGKSNLKFGYVLEGSNVRRYRVEERTPDGFIVGEYGVLNNQNAFLRGVRYTADGTINPRLIHEALMKFLSLRRRR